MNRPWTDREDHIMRELYPHRPTQAIAAQLGRALSACYARAKFLELKKSDEFLKGADSGRIYRERRSSIGSRLFTPDEEKVIRNLYADLPTALIAAQIGRTVSAVCKRARLLGIEKSAAFRSSPLSGRLQKGDPRGAKSRFQKGSIPPNKGKKGVRLSPSTEFQKGQRPYNAVPVGTVVTSTAGYLRRKIAEPNKWEFVHRRVWEDAHGPIPKGFRIWWKDRDHQNCALDNLELISSQEHISRTTIHNLPAALREVIHLKGAINRKIRRIDAQKQAV